MKKTKSNNRICKGKLGSWNRLAWSRKLRNEVGEFVSKKNDNCLENCKSAIHNFILYMISAQVFLMLLTVRSKQFCDFAPVPHSITHSTFQLWFFSSIYTCRDFSRSKGKSRPVSTKLASVCFIFCPQSFVPDDTLCRSFSLFIYHLFGCLLCIICLLWTMMWWWKQIQHFQMSYKQVYRCRRASVPLIMTSQRRQWMKNKSHLFDFMSVKCSNFSQVDKIILRKLVRLSLACQLNHYLRTKETQEIQP